MDLCHNARIKRFPDGSGELLVGSMPFGGGQIFRDHAGADEPIFRRGCGPGSSDEEAAYAELERVSIQQGEGVRTLGQDKADAQARSLLRSVRRARNAVKDLARSNDWSYFVTLTLDPEKVDRYDPVEVLKHLRHWLGNNVRRKGLRYVIVPEHHKDGAIHFHGLFNDALEAVDSGTVSVPGRKAPVKPRSEAQKRAFLESGGHTVYNLPGWGWGFSTAIQLYGEKDAAINYVCKYIGKEMDSRINVRDGVSRETYNPTGKIGGRWYYSGGDLKRPEVEWLDVDVRDFDGFRGWFSPVALPGVRFLKMRVTPDGEVVEPWGVPPAHDEGAEHGSARNACPSGDEVSGGEEGSPGGGDEPLPIKHFNGRGAFFGLSEETIALLLACGNEEAFDAAVWAAVLYSGGQTEGQNNLSEKDGFCYGNSE